MTLRVRYRGLLVFAVRKLVNSFTVFCCCFFCKNNRKPSRKIFHKYTYVKYFTNIRVIII